jgi:hypothetical protein
MELHQDPNSEVSDGFFSPEMQNYITAMFVFILHEYILSFSRGKNFLFTTSSRPALGPTHPPIQWVPGALSPRIKRPGRKPDHSPPTITEIK